MVAKRIRHTVAFALVHAENSAEERAFLEAAERLAAIPGVEAFELLAEDPDHVRFVQERWLSEVGDFLELDYTAR